VAEDNPPELPWQSKSERYRDHPAVENSYACGNVKFAVAEVRLAGRAELPKNCGAPVTRRSFQGILPIGWPRE
jgi:hypothetical protein